MKIVAAYPPNIQAISAHFPVTDETVFAYSPDIYVPSGKHLEDHLILHETIHIEQQKEKPEAWWEMYLTDPDFRLSQELMAFAAQYALITRTRPVKTQHQALFDFAKNLSGELYGNIISYRDAENAIRKKAKAYAER